MVSSYFSRKEFACKCGCGFAAVDVELLEILELVREQFESPVTVTSGCRCDIYNDAVGGTVGSKHKLGLAADIQVKEVSAREVYRFLDERFPDALGLGSYEDFTHVDVRPVRARWMKA